MTEAASLPYAGTSGFSGTDASMERALTRDATGKTGRVQRAVLDAAAAAGLPGVTIKDLRLEFPDEHHGTLSGALTALHQEGRLARLSTQRDRCSLYVLPINVLDRETLDPAKPKRREAVGVRPQDDANYVGAQVLAHLVDGADEVIVRRER